MSRLLTVPDAAILIGRDPSSLRVRIRKGHLAVIEDPNRYQGATRYVRESDVLALTWSNRSANGTRRRPNPTTGRVPLVPRDASRRALTPPDLSRGACRGEDSELFFREDVEAERQCHAICLRCPVVAQCRTWFLEREEFTFGGGMSAKQRADWRRMNGVTVTGSAVIRL